MNILEEFDVAKKLVEEDGFTMEMLIDNLAERKVYHTVAILVLMKSFNLSKEDASVRIYDHEFYSMFKNEVNPFNDEFLGNNTD